MNDDVKAAVEWLRELSDAGEREYSERGLNPVDERIDALLAHIDGEQARQDAAVAAAREEQREADARFIRSDEATWDSAHELDEVIRLSPLTATPLADRIAELEERMAVVLHAGPSTALAVSVFDRAEKAEAERDAWKAKAIRDPSQLAETLWSECYADLAAANVQNIAERDAAIQESVRLIGHRNEIRAERDALRAQVEAARALAKREARPSAGGASVTSEAARDMRRRLAKDVLAAMDGAKPK